MLGIILKYYFIASYLLAIPVNIRTRQIIQQNLFKKKYKSPTYIINKVN